jgi:hypothetical protein
MEKRDELVVNKNPDNLLVSWVPGRMTYMWMILKIGRLS